MNVRGGIFVGAYACQHPSSPVVKSPGTAEIGQDDTAATSECCHKNVFWLEVPMDNGLFMDIFQGNKNLSYNNRSLNVMQSPIPKFDV